MAIFRGTTGTGSSDNTIVSAVTEQAGIATTKAGEAEGFRDEAEGFKNTASTAATTATTKATEANASATTAESNKDACVFLRGETYDLAQDALASANAAEASATTANSSAVQTVAGSNTQVVGVYNNIANVNTVAGVNTDVTTVAGISSDVTTVAADASDIGTVSTNIANVNNVGNNIANVNAVHGNASNINTVAADGTDIGTVATNIANVNTVAGISSNVTTVAGLESKMDTVIADASDIGAVAGNIGDVTTVAGINSDVDTVAGIAAKVTTVADNITDVQNADTNATNAASSASNASASATSASNSATTATTKATEASNSATAASNSATTATTKASQAAGSATTAGTSASTATTKASEASASATTATTKAGEAASSASAASGSATTATTKAAEADVSATSAATSATKSSNAASTWNNFYNSYLGVADAPPSVDVLGNAIVAGALYYDTGAGSNTVGLYVYNGSSWVYSTNYNNVTAPYSLAQDLSTNGNDISFGDNDKAKFGASDDLQIYHDGSNSYIKDGGTGNLRIIGDQVLIANASNNEFKAVFNSDGASELYHNGSKKIATTSTGIDVTGTATMGGLTVDGGGVSTLSNIGYLGDNTGSVQYTLRSSDAGTGTIDFGDSSDGNIGRIQYIHASNAMTLRTNNTERLRINSSGNVGIGTTSPHALLHVDGGDVKISSDQNTSNGDGKPTIFFSESTANEVHAAISYHGDDVTGNNNFVGIGCSGAVPKTQAQMKEIHQLVVNSVGNVGIGTSSPATALDVRATIPALRLEDNQGGDKRLELSISNDAVGRIKANQSASQLAFETTNTERLRIDSSGNVGIGTSSPSRSLDVQKSTVGDVASFRGSNAARELVITSSTTTSTGDTYTLNANSTNGVIAIATGSTERMRIDSSGNLLVGTTGDVVATDSGTGFSYQASSGYLAISRDTEFGDASVMYLNRTNSDGQCLQLRKDGTTVGSIGTASGDLNINGGANHSGIRFQATGLYPLENGTVSSGEIDLGAAGSKFKNLYLSGGVHLGGTGTANKLDDYEEGTWTPTITGSTSGSASLTVSSATYVKVGALVTVQCYLQAIDGDNSTAAGNLLLGGLPFTAEKFTASTFTHVNCFNFDEEDISVSGYTTQGGTTVSFVKGSGTANINSSALSGTNKYLMFHATYKTTA